MNFHHVGQGAPAGTVHGNGLAARAEIEDRLAAQDAARRAWLDLRCAEERLRIGRRGRGRRTRQAGREGP